ncbi:MAG: MFS transporter [Anaerovoracaceae bacterium]
MGALNQLTYLQLYGCLVFFLTANAGISVYVLFLCPIIIGLSGSLGSMGPTVWAQSLSSKKNLTRTISHFQIATMAGGIICTLLPGIIADYTGSYSPAFILFILMLAIVLVLIKHLYGKVEKANKKRLYNKCCGV